MQTLDVSLHCTISNWDSKRIKSSQQQGKQCKFNPLALELDIYSLVHHLYTM